MVFNRFKGRIFPIRPIKGRGRPDMLNHAVVTYRVSLIKYRLLLIIPTPKQRLQNLPIALAKVRAGNKFEILLNEIC